MKLPTSSKISAKKFFINSVFSTALRRRTHLKGLRFAAALSNKLDFSLNTKIVN